MSCAVLCVGVLIAAGVSGLPLDKTSSGVTSQQSHETKDPATKISTETYHPSEEYLDKLLKASSSAESNPEESWTDLDKPDSSSAESSPAVPGTKSDNSSASAALPNLMTNLNVPDDNSTINKTGTSDFDADDRFMSGSFFKNTVNKANNQERTRKNANPSEIASSKNNLSSKVYVSPQSENDKSHKGHVITLLEHNASSKHFTSFSLILTVVGLCILPHH